MEAIPDHIKKYLWDIDLSELTLKDHYKFVIERVLEFGDKKAFDWLTEKYSQKQISDVLKVSKRISAKTGNFFSIYYKIPKEELLCIQNPFTQRQHRF